MCVGGAEARARARTRARTRARANPNQSNILLHNYKAVHYYNTL